MPIPISMVAAQNITGMGDAPPNSARGMLMNKKGKDIIKIILPQSICFLPILGFFKSFIGHLAFVKLYHAKVSL